MKKPLITGIVAITTLLIMTNCSKVKETTDSLDCLNKLVKLSNDDSDDLSCSELSAELSKIESSCGEYLSDEDRANIALIKASCED